MLLGLSNFAFALDNNAQTQDSLYIEQNEDIKGNRVAYEKALEAINNKDFAKAIPYLNAYISSKPKKYEAYSLRGDCYYALRNYNLAMQDYQTAVDLKASDDKLLTGTKYISAVVLGADKYEQLQNPELGNLYAKLMYAQKALNDPAYELSYNKALEYNSHIYLPQPKKSEISMINCPQKYGKVLNPTGVDKFIYGAIDQIENGNYTDAIFKSQYITSNYPNYYLGYYLNGVALEALDKSDEAVIAFNKALSLNKFDFESLASIGGIYFDKAQKTFSQDDARKSINYFNKALEYNPNCYIYYFYIALNEMQLGNYDIAISNFNKAIKLKQNDYNSLYYKAIAQYIKKDYSAVVDGTTKLLYKHVSNYNSVLYLRALALYKMQEYDKASADLDSIIGNMNDIYNADVRDLSPKEKTLENYVYYLKAQIAMDKGDGAVSDLEKAYKNPILAQLAQAKDAIRPYEELLNSEVLTLDDYKNFNAFYSTSLPKLLESGVVITENDVDNQYDYIRTTFDDMGLSFVYVNPDYKLTTIKDYPYKKYYSRLSAEDINALNSETSEEVKNEALENKKVTPELSATSKPEDKLPKANENPLSSMFINPILAPVAAKPVSAQIEDASKTSNLTDSTSSLAKQVSENANAAANNAEQIAENAQKLKSATPQEETLISPDESSLAMMLATNSFGTVQKDQSERIKSSINAPESVKQTVAPAQETVIVASNDSSAELSTYVAKPSAVNEENAQQVKQIMEEEKLFENVESKTSETKPKEVVEKHANVDLEGLGVQQKLNPEIKASDEVIILDPSKKTLYSDEEIQTTDSIVNNKINKGENFSGFDSNLEKIKSAVESQVNAEMPAVKDKNLQEEPPIVLPEEFEEDNKLESQVVPVVNVPEINIPKSEKKIENVSEKVVNSTPQSVEKSDINVVTKEVKSESINEAPEPQSEKELENFLKGAQDDFGKTTQTFKEGSSSDDVQIAKEKIEIEKIKANEEAKAAKEAAKAAKETAKAEKERLKEELKKQKEQLKAEAKAKKEQIKEEKIRAKEIEKQLKEEAKIKQQSLIESQKSEIEEQKPAQDIQKIDEEITAITEKEKSKAEKQMEKKIKAAQKAKEKAEAKALKEQQALEKLINMYSEYDKDDYSEPVKKTVIKQLEK